MKKKIVILAVIFLAGTLLAYPAVDIVIEDIIDRDLPDVQPDAEHVAVVDYIWLGEGDVKKTNPEETLWPDVSDIEKIPSKKALIVYTRFEAEKPSGSADLPETPANATAAVIDRFKDAFRELVRVTVPSLFGYPSGAGRIDENEATADGVKFAAVTYTNFLDIDSLSAINAVSAPGRGASAGRLAYTDIKDISTFYGIKNTEAAVVYIKPLEVPLLKLKLSLIGGFIIALPFIGYILGKELFRHFRTRIAIPIKKKGIVLFSAAVLASFILGASYAYFLMAPLFIRFLYTNAASAGVQATYSIYEFVSFVGLMTLIFGLIFEFPIVTLVLNRAGIIRREWLKTYRRHVYVGLFILAAIITPPDVISQIIVAIPMIFFYEISVFLVRIMGRKDLPAAAGIV